MRSKITVARIEKGISQKDLAEMLGISRVTLSRLENGHTKILKEDLVRRISKILDKTPQELFFCE